MSNKKYFRNEELKISFVFSFCSIALVVIFLLARIQTDSFYIVKVVKILGLSLFVLLAPNLLIRFCQNKRNFPTCFLSYTFNQFILISLIIFLGFINFSILNLLQYVIIIFGIMLFVLSFNSFFCKKIDYITVLIIIPLSILIFAIIWDGYCAHPLFIEKIISGNELIDVLFHSSIANLYNTYNLPTTGLDGIVFFNYHSFSHFIFGKIILFLNVSPIEFYNIGYPIMIIPLFLNTMMILVLRVKEILGYKNYISWVNWVVFAIVLINIVPFHIEPFRSYRDYTRIAMLQPVPISESLGVSLICLFYLMILGIEFIHKKILDERIFLYFFMPVLLFAITFAKFSVGLISVFFCCYLFFRFKLFLKSKYVFATILSLLLVYFAYLLDMQPPSQGDKLTVSFCFLKSFIYYANAHSFNFKILISVFLVYLWLILFVIFAIKKSKLLVELLAVFVLISFIPGNILTYNHFAFIGNSYYFLIVGVFVSIPLFVASYNPDFKYNWRSILAKLPLLVACILSILVLEEYHTLGKHGYRQTLARFNEVKKTETYNEEKKLIDYLILLNNNTIKQKRKMALFIPKTNKLYWNIFSDKFKCSLIAPALSGIQMIAGLPDKKTIYYSGNIYNWDKKNNVLSGFDEWVDTIIILNEINNKFVVDVLPRNEVKL